MVQVIVFILFIAGNLVPWKRIVSRMFIIWLRHAPDQSAHIAQSAALWTLYIFA